MTSVEFIYLSILFIELQLTYNIVFISDVQHSYSTFTYIIN